MIFQRKVLRVRGSQVVRRNKFNQMDSRKKAVLGEFKSDVPPPPAAPLCVARSRSSENMEKHGLVPFFSLSRTKIRRLLKGRVRASTILRRQAALHAPRLTCLQHLFTLHRVCPTDCAQLVDVLRVDAATRSHVTNGDDWQRGAKWGKKRRQMSVPWMTTRKMS